MGSVMTISVDLAKRVFQVRGADARGKEVFNRQVRRAELLREMRSHGSCRVSMEACGSAHYWAREFQQLGHRVMLIPPQYVKPYVRGGHKNDKADACAIAEAASRPEMPEVPVKAEWQQDIASMACLRDALVVERTRLSNQIRGLLLEYGVSFAKGHKALRAFLLEYPMQAVGEREGKVSPALLAEFSPIRERLERLSEDIAGYEQKLTALTKAREEARRLQTIPGIGPLTTAAILAHVGDARSFPSGRALAAWIGLVPRQHSSGGKAVLLGITKRGNKQLRQLLVHGARACLRFADTKQDRMSRWAKQLMERRGMNKATVALANKNARIVWSILRYGGTYDAAFTRRVPQASQVPA